jgi:hypothetical protein
VTPQQSHLVDAFRELAVFALGAHQGDLADFCLERSDAVAAIPAVHVAVAAPGYAVLVEDLLVHFQCAGEA